MFGIDRIKLIQFGLVIACALCFVALDVLSAMWAKNNNKFFLIAILIFAPSGYIIFSILNKYKTLSLSSGLVNTTIAILSILIGIFFFKDEITARQFTGLMFAVISVALLMI